MKQIRLLLDYKCYPMWIYDEDGDLIDNNLVEELRNEKEIDEMLIDIQKFYESLFVDDAVTLEYKGFATVSERTVFIKKIENVLNSIKKKVGEEYLIINDINI